MMQEQKKLKENPNEDDGSSYPTFNKFGYIGLVILIGGLVYLNNWAERQSQANLDFFEEEITGLKEIKENKSLVGGDWTLVDT